MGNWSFADNYDQHENGRIWFFWDSNRVHFSISSCTAQCIHGKLTRTDGSFICWISVIYGFNQLQKRCELWEEIMNIAGSCGGAWCVAGDFNNVLKMEDRNGGAAVHPHEFRDLRIMMNRVGLFECDTDGDYFTWSNRHKDGLIYSRIDHVLGNVDWFNTFGQCKVEVLKPQISDHCLLSIELDCTRTYYRAQFKFLNHLVNYPDFKVRVAESWRDNIVGDPMFILWEKLKRLKPVLRSMLNRCSRTEERIKEAREKLEEAQAKLCDNRFDTLIFEEEVKCRAELNKWLLVEESILAQKAKITWMKLGDGNNKYFQAVVKEKNKKTNIHKVQKDNVELLTNQRDIEQEVLSFYKMLLGSTQSVRGVDIVALRGGPQVSAAQIKELCRPVENADIEEALKSLGDHKAPGIDGFNAKFFKAAWDIVGEDVRRAVKFFFDNKRMFPAINCTLVTLIPKKKDAMMMRDMRPISCCTTVYKIISKILTRRLGNIIGDLVDISQAAFVPGRNIHDNIFITQELLRGYGRKYISPRCMIQMDLQKAYDTVEWGSVRSILLELGFPGMFVEWIMAAIGTVSYRYSVNGTLTEILRAKRGLRQGDPVSPHLFVLVMEYLHRKLLQLKDIPDFNFHPKCSKLNLINICFADDLMLFCRGDVGSVNLMLKKFNDFSEATGLKVNFAKCNVFFGGVKHDEQQDILAATGFTKGALPVKYLGVPLDCKKISVAMYTSLVDRITERMKHWTGRLLSYSGRLQLIKAVIMSMVQYWMQIFPFPKKVIKHIQDLCRSFLWSGKELITRKASISWDKVCDPKNAGGLKVMDLECWNLSLIAKLLWSLSDKADKLWVKWIHAYFMKGKSVQEYHVQSSSSWIVRKMMKNREKIMGTRTWKNLKKGDKFPARSLYKEMRLQKENRQWRKLFYNNYARPRAIFILWMNCWGRLYTNDRLCRFGLKVDKACYFCGANESKGHLFFECPETNEVWVKILKCLNYDHKPGVWEDEVGWILKMNNKNARSCLAKMALAETTYQIWRLRNLKKNGKGIVKEMATREILAALASRCEDHRKMRDCAGVNFRFPVCG